MQNTLLRAIICLIILGLAAPHIYAADNSALPELKTKVKSLAAFKNGLAFVFREGTTELKDGWAQIGDIPPAILGTLWIGTPGTTGKVDQVIACKKTIDEEHDVMNVMALLRLNISRKLAINYALSDSQEPRRVECTVQSINPDIIIVKTAEGKTIAMSPGAIKSVEMDSDAVLKTKDKITANCAKVHISNQPESAEVSVAYLEKGITWSPSYMVSLVDDRQADISLEAVLANDMEDIEDADVHFVVGYPNFAFSEKTTPLSLNQSVAQFISSLGARYEGRQQSYVMLQNSEGAYTGSNAQPELGYSVGSPMAGESSEDLYFYHQQHVTLKRGDRARYIVFSGRIPYEHIYQLDLPDTANAYSYNSSRENPQPPPQVWHTLRLNNTMGKPWTTAPAFTMNGSTPIAQDTIKYTPNGAKSSLKLTVATDVQCEQAQTELGRVTTQVYNNNYYEVTVGGKAVISNFKREAVNMSITKSLQGEVIQNEQGGKVTKVVKQLSAVNPDSQIYWEFKLEPGQTKELTYKYKVLIRQ